MQYLGIFASELAAALFFDVAVIWLRGPTARLNFEDRRAATIQDVVRYQSNNFSLSAAALDAGAARGRDTTQTAVQSHPRPEAALPPAKRLRRTNPSPPPPPQIRTSTPVRGIIPDSLVLPRPVVTSFGPPPPPPSTFFAFATPQGPGPRRVNHLTPAGTSLATLEHAALDALRFASAASAPHTIAALDVSMNSYQTADASMRSFRMDDDMASARTNLDASMRTAVAFSSDASMRTVGSGGMLARTSGPMSVEEDDRTFFTQAAGSMYAGGANYNVFGGGVIAVGTTTNVEAARWSLASPPAFPSSSQFHQQHQLMLQQQQQQQLQQQQQPQPPPRIITFGSRGGGAQSRLVQQVVSSRIDYYTTTSTYTESPHPVPGAMVAAGAAAGSSGGEGVAFSPHRLAGAAALIHLSAASENTLR